MFFYIPLIWLISWYVSTSVMTQVINTKNTTEPIICGDTDLQNVNHTKLHYEVSPYSQVQLPSCENGQFNAIIYWFTVADLCKTNRTNTASFATVYSNGTYTCSSRSTLNISTNSCINDYNFTRQSMIIKNMTHTKVSEYICFHQQNQIQINPTSALSYSIKILDTPTSTVASILTTQPTIAESITSSSIKANFSNGTIPGGTSSGATSMTIAATSHASPNPSILPIVLPIIFGLLIIIVLVPLGIFCYRRWDQNHETKSSI
ncbi:hypothetical protein I4U23_021093 [Adineta vaga]|nr:hypothetical protein I4U23_021093 [Adineta vaga]